MIPTFMYFCLFTTVCCLGQSRIRYYVDITNNLPVSLFALLFVILLIYNNQYERDKLNFTGSSVCDKFIICLIFFYGPACALIQVFLTCVWIFRKMRFYTWRREIKSGKRAPITGVLNELYYKKSKYSQTCQTCAIC